MTRQVLNWRRPSYWLGLFLFAISVFRPSISRGVSFFEPRFENLIHDDLERDFKGEGTDKILAGFFLTESYVLRGEIHRAMEVRARVKAWCDSTSSEDGHVAGTCALQEIPYIEKGKLWEFSGNYDRLQKFRHAALMNLKGPEKFYFEGRFYGSLPLSAGRSYSKSLLAFQMLLRVRPDVHSTHYWMGRVYEEQGALDRAKESYRLALASEPPDKRSQLQNDPEAGNRTLRDRMDGRRFGLTPYAFYHPSRGYGGGVRYIDDNVGDKDRQLSLGALAGSRRFIDLDGSWSDRTIFREYDITLASHYSYGVEDFYGFGNTASSARGELRASRFDATLSALRQFFGDFYFKLGWSVKGFAGDSPLGTAATQTTAADLASHWISGAVGELGYDSRDSRYFARSGYLVSVGGFFPSRGIGSDVTFSSIAFTANAYFPIALHHTVHFENQLRAIDGNVPFGFMNRLGATFIPGTREGRFQERYLTGHTLYYFWNVWGPFTVGAFVAAANSGPDFNSLLQNTFSLGYGGSLTTQTTSSRAQFVRIEVGQFGGETNFIVSGGKQF